jgi:competence protein ComEC
MLTHDHLDHIGGAAALLRELEIGQLWLGAGASRSPRLSALRALARENGTAIVLAEQGRRALVAGIPIRVLAPGRSSERVGKNDESLVLLFGEPGRRLLVPGDLEERGERALLVSSSALRAEALIVAHHGSRHGTGQAFLDRVNPSWALISVGRRNPFGHPHRELLDRLRDHGAPVIRTDESGNVSLRATDDGWVLTHPLTPRTAARE